MAETGTALSVVEAQQSIVGGTLVGAAGAGVLAETPSDSTSQILEQIREIQTQTLRAVRRVADGIMEMVAFNKLQDRRELEDKTEDEKENIPALPGPTPKEGADPGDVDKKTGGFFGFLGGLPGAGFLKKIIAPITAFFGKSGLLVKLFGKFGPLGALILGFTLVYKYSDEIAQALAPALDKIKSIITKMQPAIDVLMAIGDFLIKGIIKGIGEALSFVFGTVEKFIDGFKMLFSGDILKGIDAIFEGIVRAVFAIPLMIINFLKPLFLDLVNLIAEPWNNMVNAIHEYVGNLFTGIGDFFSGIYDSVIGFFTTAYENAKTQITNDINGMLSFVSDIFTTIYDAIASAVTAVKDFVVGIPDRILGFVSSMFDPIINFFSSIGNSIKNAINGIIDSLPLPDFIKNKVKFDTTPTDEQIAKGSEELAKDDTPQAKSIVKQIAENKDAINAYAEARGLPFNLEQTMIAANQNGPSLNPRLIFGNSNLTDMMTLDGLQKATDMIALGDSPTAQEQLKEEKANSMPKVTMADLPPVAGGDGAGVNITNNNFNTSNNSVASQTDVHSGKLDTGIDPYFEKNAVATT